MYKGSVQLSPAMNQPLESIHHVFYPVLLSPLSLNKDHPGLGEDTMESSISAGAATLMYLCKKRKRKRGNQRVLLEVLKCIRMETKKLHCCYIKERRLL